MLILLYLCFTKPNICRFFRNIVIAIIMSFNVCISRRSIDESTRHAETLHGVYIWLFTRIQGQKHILNHIQATFRVYVGWRLDPGVRNGHQNVRALSHCLEIRMQVFFVFQGPSSSLVSSKIMVIGHLVFFFIHKNCTLVLNVTNTKS